MPKSVPYSHDALVSALIAYDRKEEARDKFHNRYALAQYLTRADDIKADIAAGADPYDAIRVAFSGRLLSAALRPFGWKQKPDDKFGDGIYRPIAAKE